MSDLTSNFTVKMGSERGFGTVFAAVFAIIGFWPLTGGNSVRIWALLAAAAFLAAALIAPGLLRPLNRLWFKFGMLLGAIVAPIVMALVFITTFVPIGFVLRLLGKDPLDRKIEPEKATYWKPRQAQPTSMKYQF